MRIPLRFALLAFVVLEVSVFALVAQAIGILAALGLILLGVATGGLLLRRQGAAMLGLLRTASAAGRLPADAVAQSGARALAAVLLMLPGFLTDAAALVILIEPLRRVLWRAGGLPPLARRAPPRQGPAVVDLDASQYASKPSRPLPTGTAR